LQLFRIITLFPEFFDSPLKTGLMGRAVDSGIIRIELVNLRDYSEDRFGRCDDSPYGGGNGMVLKPEPISRAIEGCRAAETRVILTTPGGRLLDQDFVKSLSGESDICIICGQYEGVDQRVIDRYVDYEVSTGDYVLSGGEYAALVILNAVSRYAPGFMSNADSLREESFEMDLLEYPQYTRPAVFMGMGVPDVLLSGDHERVREWRMESSIEKTRSIRPDLYDKYIRRKRGE
jgi:tRNA (guanine37-N1)-methyltransferase